MRSWRVTEWESQRLRESESERVGGMQPILNYNAPQPNPKTLNPKP